MDAVRLVHGARERRAPFRRRSCRRSRRSPTTASCSRAKAWAVTSSTACCSPRAPRLLALTFNVMAGYAFAKLRFAGREQIFRALLGAIVIPAQVAMLPLFLAPKEHGAGQHVCRRARPGARDHLRHCLVRQYALSIPDEMLEAARVDGASEFRIFVSIVVPALRPILATLATFTFLGTWNDFMWPLIVLSDASLYTLPVALASLSREHVQDNELMMAGSVVTMLPVLLLFLVLQRHYIEGLLAGSVKG